MVSELGLDRGVRVHGVAEGGDGQGEGRVLERSHHRAAGLKGILRLYNQRSEMFIKVKRKQESIRSLEDWRINRSIN